MESVQNIIKFHECVVLGHALAWKFDFTEIKRV